MSVFGGVILADDEVGDFGGEIVLVDAAKVSDLFVDDFLL